MTERNQLRLKAAPKANEHTIATERADEEEAWENVFTAITDLAKLKNRPVNQFAPSGTIKAEGDTTADYKLRINPALLTDEGKIEAIVVDVTYLEKPSQQWVAKAEWLDGEPNLVGVDQSTTGEEGKAFSSRDVAIYAEKIVRSLENMSSLEPHNFPSVTMYIPRDYSTRIH
jgi:hypothetical protein